MSSWTQPTRLARTPRQIATGHCIESRPTVSVLPATLGHQRGGFPVAEAAAEQVLSLPLFPEITVEQQAYVASELERSLLKPG